MLSDFFEPFVMQDWKSTADGLGSFTWSHTDGAAFMAGITSGTAKEQRLAAQNGLKTAFTIVTEKNINLEHGDRVKRIKDGKTYVITSNCRDAETPIPALMQYWQVSAEVLEV